MEVFQGNQKVFFLAGRKLEQPYLLTYHSKNWTTYITIYIQIVSN